jgi:hypothetical protein
MKRLLALAVFTFALAVPLAAQTGGVVRVGAGGKIAVGGPGSGSGTVGSGASGQVAAYPGTGTTVAGTNALTGITIDGVTPTTFGFLDATSSIQTQLNSKAPLASPTFTNAKMSGALDPCDNTPTLLVTEAYLATCAATGNVSYPSAAVNSIPVVTNATGPVLGNSDLADNPGIQVQSGVPLYLAAGSQIEGSAPALATSSANATWGGLLSDFNYWSGSTSIPDQIINKLDVCNFGTCGATPTVYSQYTGPTTIPFSGLELTQNSALAASLNVAPPGIVENGYYDNSGTGALEVCSDIPTLGTGSNPTVTRTHGCTGSTGAELDVFTNPIQVTGGAAGILNNGATWVGGTGAGPTETTGSIYSQTNATFSNEVVQVNYAGTWYNIGPNMIGAPSLVNDAGAGTSPTSSLSTGATDGRGIITVTTGTSPTGGNVGIVSMHFSMTEPSTPYCTFSPGNANAAALSGATGVFIATPTTTQFVLTSGSTALAAATTYAWEYRCAL